MDLIQKANKLGYKHYTEFTVEELDNLPLSNSDKQIEYFFIQKWIREVHNIHMKIQVFNDDTWGGDLIYKDAEYEHNDYNAPLDVENCKTYEEALELLLQKALMLIKND